MSKPTNNEVMDYLIKMSEEKSDSIIKAIILDEQMSDKITDRCPDCGEIVFEGKDTFYCQSCETWFSREEMENEITTEEMVNEIDASIRELEGDPLGYAGYERLLVLQAIRQCLIDYAELTKKLSEVKLDVQNPNRLGIEVEEE